MIQVDIERLAEIAMVEFVDIVVEVFIPDINAYTTATAMCFLLLRFCHFWSELSFRATRVQTLVTLVIPYGKRHPSGVQTVPGWQHVLPSEQQV